MSKRKEYMTDAIKIFLDYISRRLQVDQNYEPHPLINALTLAFEKAQQSNDNKPVIGVSGQNRFGKVFNSYGVVIKKHNDGTLEVKEIRDLTMDKEVSIRAMVTIFRLQIFLDRTPGEQIDIDKAVNALNKVFITPHFYALGDRWKDAMELFAKNLREGKISLPSEFKTDGTVDELLAIRTNTPWEDITPRVRGLIGGAAGDLFDKRSAVILTTPLSIKAEKFKILEFANQQLLGTGAMYTGEKDCIFCDPSQISNYIFSIWDNFILLLDRNPLMEGHILVISKDHVHAMGDLTREMLAELSELLEAIKNFYKSWGKEKFIMFEPGFAGQSIFHAHIHFIPSDFLVAEAVHISGLTSSKLNQIEDIEDFYKENGGYLMWSTGDQLYAANVNDKKLPPSYFRSLIASYLMRSDLTEWKNYAQTPKLKKQAKEDIQITNTALQRWRKQK